jgi:hypothetical protein
MTAERFRELLAAYGADVERWPEGERAAARLLRADDPPALRQALADEAGLDDWLDQHVSPAPDPALARRILAAAIAPALPRRSSRRHAPRWLANAWGPGAGLTITGLAGALAGALVVSVALRQAAPAAAAVDWQARATAFGELAGDGSEE